MPKEKVGSMKTARRIIEQYRSAIAVDDNSESKEILLNSFFKWRIGNYLWMIIAIGIFHLKLLHAIIYPLHSFLTKGFKAIIYSNGEMCLPLFFLYKAIMVFFALSVIWQCFTWPNSMGILQWNFSVQPQISSTSCSDQMETIGSQSGTMQCKMNEEIDLNVDARFGNIILNSILTVYRTIIDFLSLASEFTSSIFGFIWA